MKSLNKLENDLMEAFEKKLLNEMNNIFENILELCSNSSITLNKAFYQENSLLLHYACYLGNLTIVKLLLKDKNINNLDNIFIYDDDDNEEEEEEENQSCSYYVEMEDNHKETPLFFACKQGHVEIVKYLLLTHNADISVCNKECETPLHYACKNGHLDIVQYLFKEYVQNEEMKSILIHAKNTYGCSCLHYACCNGHIDIIKFFLADMKIQDNDIRTDNDDENLLHYACRSGYLNIVKLLATANNPMLTMKNSNGFTVFHQACLMGNVDIVSLLYEIYPKFLDILSVYGTTAIHSACLGGRVDVLKLLLDFYHKNTTTTALFDINQVDVFENNALHHVARGYLDLSSVETDIYYKHLYAKLCLLAGKHSEPIIKLNYLLHTPKHQCHCPSNEIELRSKPNYCDTAKVLIDHKIIINKQNKKGETALHLTCHTHGQDSIIELLLNAGADPNLLTMQEKYSPLYLAYLNNKHDAIKIFLGRGINNVGINETLNSPTKQLEVIFNAGYTLDVLVVTEGIEPLHLACKRGDIKIVELLINAGINPDLPDWNDQTPLHIACKEGQLEIVQYLLRIGANPNSQDDYTIITPIFYACEYGHLEITKALISYDADINYRNKRDETPLYYACVHNHIEIIKVLIAAGADTSLCDWNDMTPLYVACSLRYIEAIKILIEGGADCKIDPGWKYTSKHIRNHHNISKSTTLQHENSVHDKPIVGLTHQKSKNDLMKNTDIIKNIEELLLGNSKNLKNHENIPPNLIRASSLSPTIMRNKQEMISNEILKVEMNENFKSPNLIIEVDEELKRSLLYEACSNGDYKRIQKILNHKQTMKESNHCKKLLFIDYSSSLLALVQNIFESYQKRVLINRKRDFSCSTSSFNDDLIESAMNSTKSNFKETYYISNAFIECLKLLLDVGADPNIKCNKTLNTPLYLVCIIGHLDSIRLLSIAGADLNSVCNDGLTSLDIVIKSIEENKYHEEVLLYLIYYTKIGIKLTYIWLHFNILSKIFRVLCSRIQYEVLSHRMDPITNKEYFRMGSFNCIYIKICMDNHHIKENHMNYILIHGNFKITDILHSILSWLKVNALNRSVGWYSLWFALLDPNLQLLTIDEKKEFIEDILKQVITHQDRKNLLEILYVYDSSRRLLIDIVDQKTKKILMKDLFFLGRYELSINEPIYRSLGSVVIQAIDHGFIENCLKVFDNIVLSSKININHKSSIDSTTYTYSNSSSCHCDITPSNYSNIIQSPSITNNPEINLTNERITIQLFQEICKELFYFQYLTESEIYSEFHQWDINQIGTMSRFDFERFCETYNDKYKKVLIKFIHEEKHYNNEVFYHIGLDNQYVMNLIESFNLNDIKDDCSSTLHHPIINDLHKYKYGIITLEAEKNLDYIIRQEHPSLHIKKKILKQLAQALQYLHSKGIIHGDLKSTNIIRIDNQIKFIYLKASKMINSEVISYLSTTSTLPPECYHKLSLIDYQSMNKLQDLIKLKDIEYVQIMQLNQKSCYIPKVDYPILSKEELSILPYKCAIALETIDIWAFGLIFYHLLSNNQSTLLPTNNYEEYTRTKDIMKAATWNDNELHHLIDIHIGDKISYQAASLLKQILTIDPMKRLSMSNILEHEFFLIDDVDEFSGRLTMQLDQLLLNTKEILTITNKIEEQTNHILLNTKKLQNLNMKIFKKLHTTEKVLLRGLLESNEVQIPTTFIVFNKKITKKMIEKQQSESKKDVNSCRDTTNKTEIDKESEKSVGFFKSLMNYTSSLTTKTEKSLNTYFGFDKLYFYLVDEVTMQPIIPDDNNDPYPIEISVPGEFLPSVAPFLMVGLRVVTAVNLLSGIVRCFGYPVPYISSQTMDEAYDFVGKINEETSINNYAMLSATVITVAVVSTAAVATTKTVDNPSNQSINSNNKSTTAATSNSSNSVADTNTTENNSNDSTNNDINSSTDSSSLIDVQNLDKSTEIKEQAKLVRGAALRQLQNFLLDNDPEHNFCGLRRVITSTGQCIWTTDENFEKLESQAQEHEDFDINHYNASNDNDDIDINPSIMTQKEYIDQSVQTINTLSISPDGSDNHYKYQSLSMEDDNNNNNNNNNIEEKTNKTLDVDHHQIDNTNFIPDTATNNCMICCSSFTVFNRRHHCRRCGYLVCTECSLPEYFLIIPEQNNNKPVRHCSYCYNLYKGE